MKLTKKSKKQKKWFQIFWNTAVVKGNRSISIY